MAVGGSAVAAGHLGRPVAVGFAGVAGRIGGATAIGSCMGVARRICAAVVAGGHASPLSVTVDRRNSVALMDAVCRPSLVFVSTVVGFGGADRIGSTATTGGCESPSGSATGGAFATTAVGFRAHFVAGETEAAVVVASGLACVAGRTGATAGQTLAATADGRALPTGTFVDRPCVVALVETDCLLSTAFAPAAADFTAAVVAG